VTDAGSLGEFLSAISDAVHSPETYAAALSEYCRTHSETALYHASLLSRAFVESDLGPEEIIALHGEAVARVIADMGYREQARASTDAIQFLLEVMIAYGVQHRQFMDLREREAARQAEAREAEERRHREAARLRVEEAEKADRLKTEALAMIAHELRTPISAALGSLDLALRALRTGRTESLPRLVGSARDAMARLTRLSADLVDASRGEAPTFALAPVEVAVLVAQACAWAGAVAEAKGVTMVRASGPFSAHILGDEHALVTIFGNLLSNAIRYTAAGGHVMVRQGTEAGWAWVEVQDTGIGMSLETQAHIFEQFFRAPEARILEQQGMGLGLTLTHRLVLAHGGTLNVDSAPDQGSTFRVTLPLVRTARSHELKEAP
jgi:signal transduction histidine kinase